jgi:hypothetical protein
MIGVGPPSAVRSVCEVAVVTTQRFPGDPEPLLKTRSYVPAGGAEEVAIATNSNPPATDPAEDDGRADRS